MNSLAPTIRSGGLSWRRYRGVRGSSGSGSYFFALRVHRVSNRPEDDVGLFPACSITPAPGRAAKGSINLYVLALRHRSPNDALSQ